MTACIKRKFLKIIKRSRARLEKEGASPAGELRRVVRRYPTDDTA